MSIQAMKMALEAMENYGIPQQSSAITALRAAIAEAERQEPVGYVEGLFDEDVIEQCGFKRDQAVYFAPQPAIPAGWQPTDVDLTRIYNESNGIGKGKSPPITTQRIFTAMRSMLQAAPKPENGHD